MPEKKKVYCKFEGIIVPSSSGEGLAETDKAWLVEISIPERYSGEQVWIAKSMVKPDIKVSGDLIHGSTESWIFKKLDKKEVESAQSEVEAILPEVNEIPLEIKMKKEYEGFVGDTPLIEVLREIRDLISIIADIMRGKI